MSYLNTPGKSHTPALKVPIADKKGYARVVTVALLVDAARESMCHEGHRIMPTSFVNFPVSGPASAARNVPEHTVAIRRLHPAARRIQSRSWTS